MRARARWMRLAAAAAAMLAGAGLGEAQAIRSNTGFNTTSVPRNDDGSGPVEQIGFTINFFGQTRSSLYVNNNGNITLDRPLATYTPFGLVGTRQEIIAAFFADVDTRPLQSKLVTYGRDTIDGKRAFGVNYVDVGYYNQHADKLNRFQLILIDRSETGQGNFDIEFNYERIAWETGDASGGGAGFGGVPAAVGWSNGTGEPGTSYELAGSLIAGSFLDRGPRALVRGRLNSTVRGRYVFKARNGSISPGLSITTACPLPSAAVGEAYSQYMSAVGTGSRQTWSLAPDPGTRLPGLTLTSDGRFSGTPSEAGTFNFTLSLSSNTEDGEQSVTRRCALTVTRPVLAITASSCPLPRGTVGAPYAASLRARGGGGAYRWAATPSRTGLPPGLTLAPDGALSGTPSAAGTYAFTVTASSASGDGATPAAKGCSVVIDPAPLEASITGCPQENATLGVPYRSTLAAAGGTRPYRWTVVGALPTGISLTPDGQISGIPAVTGEFPFRLRASDARGGQAEQACFITIGAPEVQINSACPLPAADSGRPYSAALSAAGGEGPYRWSVLGTLPPGIALNPDGRLSGTAASAGPYPFRLLVEDLRGAQASVPCNLVVRPASLGVASCPMPDGTYLEPYAQPLRAASGVEPLFWSVSGRLPEGLSAGPGGILYGTPREGGVFPFHVSVTDALGNRASQACSVRVNPPALQIASACPLPSARVGLRFETRVGAIGGVGELRWSPIGTLPPGLSLDGSGVLSGTPETAGAYGFALRATDAWGQSIVKDCSLAVELPGLPSLQLGNLAATLPPASPVNVSLSLAEAYAIPLEGEVTVEAKTDTGNVLGELDRPDPAVRFPNGQRALRFSIPAGEKQATVRLESTGTVASQIELRVTELQAGGVSLRLLPAPRSFKVARLAPAITDACFRPIEKGLELSIAGYSTTRQLTRADVTIAGAVHVVDLEGPSYDWFLSDESVRYGSTFSLKAPFELKGISPASVTSVTLTITNSAGTAPSRQANRCPGS